MLPWRRNFSTLPWCRNFSSLVLGILKVLNTQQRINTIIFASLVLDLFLTSTVLELLLSCSRNHCNAWYLTTDQHNLPCFHGVGPFPHFRDVGTSPLLFLESLWCLIPNTGSAQSFTFPRGRTISTLPQCRNFSSLVLGIVEVLDTQQRISRIFYAFTA